jgi:hypothetical protein
MSFHLNEMVYFDQNGLFWYKTIPFWPAHKKKKMSIDLSSDYCSSSSTFCTRKAARIATFSEHSMLHLSTKSDKPYTTMMAWHCTTPQHNFLLVDCPYSSCGAALKRVTGLAFSSRILAAHDDDFEPTVEILLDWIKGQDWSSIKTRCPSSPL